MDSYLIYEVTAPKSTWLSFSFCQISGQFTVYSASFNSIFICIAFFLFVFLFLFSQRALTTCPNINEKRSVDTEQSVLSQIILV